MVDFSATSGVNSVSQSGGNDRVIFTDQSQVQGGDFFDGGGGTDTIVIGSGGAGVTLGFLDFLGGLTNGFHNYEAIEFTNTTGSSTVTFKSTQFGTGLISDSLHVSGAAGAQTIIIDHRSPTTSFSAENWTFTDWDASTDIVQLLFGSQAVTGSTQRDVISISGGGSASGLAGDDTINAITPAATSGVIAIDGGADNDAINLIGGSFSGTIDGGSGIDSLTLLPAVNSPTGLLTLLTVTNVENLFSEFLIVGSPEQFEVFDHIALPTGSTQTHVQITLNAAGTADLADELDGVNASFHPWSGGNTIISGNGDDIFAGGSATVFYGGAGNDQYLAGGGVGTGNTAGFGGAWKDYLISIDGGGVYTLVDQRAGSPDGTDTVASFAAYIFSNGTFSYTQILNDAPTDIALSSATIIENAADGSTIGTLSATDADTALGDTATFTLLDNAGGRFALSGNAIVAADGDLLDREVATSHQITVRVTDVHGLTYEETLTITVTDQNDSAPVVTSSSAPSVLENTAAVVVLAATDADTIGGPVTFSITGGADQALFEIAGDGHTLQFISAPDYETDPHSYTVEVTASDGTNATIQTLTIAVTDQNDNAPVFSSGTTANVAENTAAATVVYDANATDADGTPANATIVYSLTGADAARFSIDPATGAVRFLAVPNFEAPTDIGANNQYDIVVHANDGLNDTTRAVAITVTDQNDFAPVFTSSSAPSVLENTAAVVVLAATDADTVGGPVTFSITGGADQALFEIAGDGHTLQFISAPDYETDPHSYTVEVTASDGTNATIQTLTISVIASNYSATTGVDTITQTNGADAVTITDQSQVQGGDFFDGSGGTDTIVIGSGGAGVTLGFLDFLGGLTNGFHNYEAIEFTNTTGSSTVTFKSTQFGTGLISNSLHVSGAAGAQTIIIDHRSPTTSFSAENWTFTDWDASTDIVQLLFGSQAVTGSTQRDVISISGGGSASGLAGDDTINAITPAATSGVIAIDGGADNDAINLIGGSFSGTIDGGSGIDSLTLLPAVNSPTGLLTLLTVTNVENLFSEFLIVGSPEQFEVFDHIALPTGSTQTHVQITLNAAGTADLADELDGVNASFHPWSGGNTIISGNGDDIFAGGSATVFYGGAGNDQYLAGGGVGTGNTAGFGGAWKDYLISIDGGGVYTLVDQRAGSPDGTDTVASFAAYIFSNGTFSYTQILNDAPTDIALSSATIIENAADGSTVGTLSATDADTALGDTATFTLLDNAGGRFALSGNAIVVADGDLLDREVATSHQITVRVTDVHGLTYEETLTITVTDQNDSDPVVTSSSAPSVLENTAAVVVLAATDADTVGGPVTFSITGGADQALFEIAGDGHTLQFISAPDYETDPHSYTVEVTASDGTNATIQTLTIAVTDQNDNAPVFSSGTTANVTENTAAATVVYDANATDADGTPANATIVYSLTGTDAARFSIDPATGAVRFLAVPNFEAPTDIGANNQYDIVVHANDGLNDTTRAVAITVTDQNDSAPVFTSSSAPSVLENTAAVVVLAATDADTVGGPVTFSITGGADQALFEIAGDGHTLQFISAPNYETDPHSYTVEVTASDGTNATIQTLTIAVTDQNDNAPVFSSGTTANVTENTAAATVVYDANATDADGTPANATIVYSLTGADAARFSIDPATGAVRFLAVPNFEAPTDIGANNQYDIVVHANDGLNDTTRAVAITVTDQNDSAPVVTSSSAPSVLENTAAVVVLAATDADTIGGPVTFSITGGADQALFEIAGDGHTLQFISAPDYETDPHSYTVEVTASDGTNATIQTLTIAVTDQNDNAPVFSSGTTANVTENTAAATVVYDANATDADGTPANATIVYSLTGADAARFSIDPATGAVRFLAVPNFEAPTDIGANNQYDIVVHANDGLNDTTRAVAITVTDQNDSAPVVTSSSAPSVLENTAAVVVLAATDADTIGGPVTFSITGGADQALFEIAGDGHTLQFISAPDYETDPHSYTVEVTASDGTNATIQTLTIAVTDQNDNAPVFSSGTTANVTENTAAATVVYDANATDADGTPANATIVYSLTGADAARFSIDPATGAVRFLAVPNFEAPTDIGANNQYDIVVHANDGLNDTTRAVAITVTDQNDFAPVFTSSSAPSVLENTAAATIVYDANATDADGTPANATIVYSLTGADASRFSINAATGEIRFQVSPDFDAPSDVGGDNAYDVVVRASDGVNSTTLGLAISVVDEFDDPTTTGNDTIRGTDAGETLNGGLGNDVLTGRGGPDSFRFDTKLNRKNNVDDITDFKVGVDEIQLDRSIFKKLKIGELKSKAFTSGKVAKDDRIIYNKNTGDLAFDKDGKGGAKAVKFAALDGSPDNLSAKDFIVIA